MKSAKERIPIARAEYDDLYSYLRTLKDEGWSRPSACDGWRVCDVTAHLIITTDFQSGMVREGLAGKAMVINEDAGVSPQSRRDAIARGAIELRERLGASLLESFTQHYDSLFRLLNSLRPEQLNLPARHPVGPEGKVTVGTYIDLVVLETALHGWDIRWAASPSARLSDQSIPVLMEYAEPWLRRILHPKTTSGEVYRYRFQVSAMKARDLVVEGHGLAETSASGSAPTATLHCDANTFLLLHFGRLSFQKALEEGLLTIDGDREAVLRLDRWVAGV